MNINSIQGMNAYTSNALTADTTSVQSNNKESTGLQADKDSSQTLQEAFQVDITQQALALQAENTEDLADEDLAQQLAQQAQQAQQNGQSQGRQGGQLDIVA